MALIRFSRKLNWLISKNLTITTSNRFLQTEQSPVNLKQLPTGLDITFASNFKNDQGYFFDYIWLRDHCRCPKCYNWKSFQKEVNYLDISEIHPVEYNHSSNELKIKWSDGHQSTYKLDWLHENHSDSYKMKERCKRLLWEENLGEKLPNMNYFPDIDSTDWVRGVFTTIFKYGFCLINNVEPTVEATESVIRQLAPIQKTFWGEMWSVYVKNDCQVQDSAFTDVYIPVHNDCTYFADSPSLQMFHCLQQAENGGETILVDGFNAAENLRRTDPLSYEYLSKTAIESCYVDQQGNHFTNFDTVIKHWPNTTELLQIRFNPLDVATIRTIPQSEIRNFYKSYSAFTKELYKPSNSITLRLEPGTLLLIDNWRVLHGRNSFQGNRRLCGCNISRTDYLSKIINLGLM